jgi:hypothetical protein
MRLTIDTAPLCWDGASAREWRRPARQGHSLMATIAIGIVYSHATQQVSHFVATTAGVFVVAIRTAVYFNLLIANARRRTA